MLPNAPSLRSSLLRLHKDIISLREMADATKNDSSLTWVEKAVIVLEDRRFFHHCGYDWKSISRELIKAATFQRHGGASTIDIQLLRTISGRYERTLRRKIRECLGARTLQLKLSKIEILRCYLKIAYFGTGITGADAAALEFYGKASDDLDMDQAAFIASLLVYPKPRIPTANWQTKVGRRAQYGRLLLRTLKQDLYQVVR